MYVDEQGMIERFGEPDLIQLTDRGMPSSGTVVSSVLEQALSDAAALVHGYARSAGYQVPFALPAPDPVPQWQALIAFYLLHRGKTPPEELMKEYDRTLAQLRDMAAGRITLQAAGVDAQPASGDTVKISTPGRVFGREGLEGF